MNFFLSYFTPNDQLRQILLLRMLAPSRGGLQLARVFAGTARRQ